jgi:GNAT superfamily N-acetyltransferase
MLVSAMGQIEPTTRAADEWWAKDFGCPPEELRPARARVQAHTARLAASSGIWILVAGGAPIVSLPADVFVSLGERAAAWTAATVSDEVQLLRELSGLTPGRVGKVIGPAPISYGSRESLDLRDAARAIAVPSEPASVAALRAACGDDWHDGGSKAQGEPLFGCVDETGQLAALASYQVWDSAIAHIYIITHPNRRGRGFARAAVARAAEHALAAGLLPQYRTLRANAPAIAVAKRLGFTEYGFSVYVRMQQT